MTVCAMLEEAGYRRDEIRGLTRTFVLRVLQHRRNEGGALEPSYRQGRGAALSAEERLRRRLARQKYPAHLAEGKVREMLRRAAGRFGG